MFQALLTDFDFMPFRRAIFILFFVLPFAVPTDISVSKHQSKTLRHDSAPTVASSSSAPAISVVPTVLPVAASQADVVDYAELSEIAESLAPAASPAPVAPPVVAVAPSKPAIAVAPVVPPAVKPSKQTASAAPKHAKIAKHAAAPTTPAVAKLSKHAVDAIAESTAAAPAPSLYDRRTAQTPESGFLNWFGPKSAAVHYDSRMIQAAQIAESRARHHSIRSCWRYVKEALVAANVVDTYPGTTYAKQAGEELINKHGFRRLAISDPFKAPEGAVLVYGGRGAGHVEIRTKDGFVSDFESPTPSKRPLLGIFVKPS